MTRSHYVTKADLTIPLSETDPITGERLRIERLHGIPLNSVSLPWPMTPTGSRIYVLIMTLGSLSGLALAIWAGYALIEPSPARLMPAVGVGLAIKFIITPALHTYGQRPGMDRRELREVEGDGWGDDWTR